jgi:hypothetical protein
MAEIKSVTVNKSRTVNIGNYNSVRFEYGITAEIDPKDNFKKVHAELNEQVEQWIETEHAKWQGKE